MYLCICMYAHFSIIIMCVRIYALHMHSLVSICVHLLCINARMDVHDLVVCEHEFLKRLRTQPHTHIHARIFTCSASIHTNIDTHSCMESDMPNTQIHICMCLCKCTSCCFQFCLQTWSQGNAYSRANVNAHI